MTEAILLLVIVALCALVGWMEFQNRKERAKMLNALVAKNHQEQINLELVDKTKPIDPQPPMDDLVPESQIPEEKFMEYVEEANGRQS